MLTVVSVRVPGELVDQLDAWASAFGRSRSAVLRALIEDAADATELPTVRATTPHELLDELRRRDDAELARLNAIARG